MAHDSRGNAHVARPTPSPRSKPCGRGPDNMAKPLPHPPGKLGILLPVREKKNKFISHTHVLSYFVTLYMKLFNTFFQLNSMPCCFSAFFLSTMASNEFICRDIFPNTVSIFFIVISEHWMKFVKRHDNQFILWAIARYLVLVLLWV